MSDSYVDVEIAGVFRMARTGGSVNVCDWKSTLDGTM